MVEERYVCTGGCGGSVSAEEYEAGTTTCGAETCEKHGEPFDKRAVEVCPTCNKWYAPGTAHVC